MVGGVRQHIRLGEGDLLRDLLQAGAAQRSLRARVADCVVLKPPRRPVLHREAVGVQRAVLDRHGCQAVRDRLVTVLLHDEVPSRQCLQWHVL